MRATCTSISSDVIGRDGFYRAFLCDFARVSSFFSYDPRSPGAAVRRREHISSRDHRAGRESVAEWLLRCNTDWGALPPALEAAEKLKDPGASVVLAQVRPALLGGDRSVLCKVLSVIEYARRLEELCETPVIPLIWVISDHNWGGIGRAKMLDPVGEVHTLALRPEPPPATPAHKIPLHPGIYDVVGEMERILRISSPQDNQVCRLVRQCSREADALNDAFCRLLVGLFSSSGVLVVDESDAGTRMRMAPVLQRAAVSRYSVEQELEVGHERLEMAGYSPPVPESKGQCHIFVDTERGRRRLIRREKIFCDEQESFRLPAGSVAEMISEDAHLFSPGEILRPIAQDAVLPVMAFVAGPDESAMRAQAGGIWSIFDTEVPPIYPQMYLTLVNPQLDSALRRAGLSIQDAVFPVRGPETIDNRREEVLDDLGGEIIRDAFGEAEQRFEVICGQLWDKLEQAAPSVEQIHEKSEDRMRWILQCYRDKAGQHLRRRHRDTVRDFRLIRNTLHPYDGSQACLSYLPCLMRYGGRWVTAVAEALADQDYLWRPFVVRWSDSG